MTRIQAHGGGARDTRTAPVPHAQALQDAKRIEKMQTVCSSHRTSGTVRLPAPSKDDRTS